MQVVHDLRLFASRSEPGLYAKICNVLVST